jgi:hypothetical protein
MGGEAEDAKRDSQGGKTVFDQGGMAQRAILIDLIHFTESAGRTSPASTWPAATVPTPEILNTRVIRMAVPAVGTTSGAATTAVLSPFSSVESWGWYS